jgi:hypothetical protein
MFPWCLLVMTAAAALLRLPIPTNRCQFKNWDVHDDLDGDLAGQQINDSELGSVPSPAPKKLLHPHLGLGHRKPGARRCLPVPARAYKNGVSADSFCIRLPDWPAGSVGPCTWRCWYKLQQPKQRSSATTSTPPPWSIVTRTTAPPPTTTTPLAAPRPLSRLQSSPPALLVVRRRSMSSSSITCRTKAFIRHRRRLFRPVSWGRRHHRYVACRTPRDTADMLQGESFNSSRIQSRHVVR